MRIRRLLRCQPGVLWWGHGTTTTIGYGGQRTGKGHEAQWREPSTALWLVKPRATPSAPSTGPFLINDKKSYKNIDLTSGRCRSATRASWCLAHRRVRRIGPTRCAATATPNPPGRTPYFYVARTPTATPYGPDRHCRPYTLHNKHKHK